MKKLRIPTMIALLCVLPSLSLAQNGLPYDSIKNLVIALKAKQVNGVSCVPFYLKSKDGKDLAKGNFRIVSKDGETIKLHCEKMSSLPVDSMTFADLDYIESGYALKMWVPADTKKYSGWVLQHDMEKESIDIGSSRMVATNKSIEERRKEYLEKLKEEKDE